MRIRNLLACLFILSLGVSTITAHSKQSLSPSQTVLAFYKALRNKQYVEGFKLSVYEAAISGLSQADLDELAPDFEETFSRIPENIQIQSEKITGDSATVFIQVDGKPVESVSLIKLNGIWRVGDRDTLELIKKQGNEFFFNTRMLVNEQEAADLMSTIIGSEFIYSTRMQGKLATLEELVKMGALPDELAKGEANGYRFQIKISADGRAYEAHATPLRYGRTGKLSFYADADSGVRAEDKRGQPASRSSPAYEAK